MPHVPAPVAVVLALLVVAAGGCTDGSPDRSAAPSAAPTTAPPTPLASYDSRDIAVARGDFCALVPAAAVRRALGATGTATSYGEGQTADLAPGVRDRSGEYACTWTAADGTVARAWVFAPPVTRSRARSLARAAGEQSGCRRTTGPAFGDPSVAVVCRAAQTRTASYAGLFVDAWLSCSVSGSTSASTVELRRRAGEWCVAVASAATLS